MGRRVLEKFPDIFKSMDCVYMRALTCKPLSTPIPPPLPPFGGSNHTRACAQTIFPPPQNKTKPKVARPCAHEDTSCLMLPSPVVNAGSHVQQPS